MNPKRVNTSNAYKLVNKDCFSTKYYELLLISECRTKLYIKQHKEQLVIYDLCLNKIQCKNN